jgi:acetylornithine/N-succinyldiaminopimelate aminotransferase
MKTSETIALYEKYSFANYTRLPVVIVRGQGSRIWDADGKEYLDFFPGWGVNGIGHCHPRVVEAIRAQAAKLIHVPNVPFYSEEQGLLAKAVSERSFGGKCFFCNSGAEANEGALKLARKFFDGKRYKIITMHNSFHGRTLAMITATAQPKYQAGFGPLPEGFTYVAFNDLAAVERVLDDKTAAVMLEPIQGEGGINVATDDYLKGLRALCDRTGTLLLLDEVQTGMGRTGTYFGYQHYGVIPDIMTLAKALGGGVAIGAMVAKPEIAAAFVPGTHASTFGGNSLACAAGLAAFETIDKEHLLDNTAKMGEYLRSKLSGLAKKYAFIKEVRGRGLMLGVELTIPGAKIVARCLENGLNINCTHDTVLRIMPAMTVTAGEIDKAMSILDGVLKETSRESA